MEKTCVMRFSRSRKWDFLPQVKFHDGTVIQTKTETKLVGVIVSQNLSWQNNTDYIYVRKPGRNFGHSGEWLRWILISIQCEVFIGISRSSLAFRFDQTPVKRY